MAREIWRRLAPRLNQGERRLERVGLYETCDLWMDYAE